MLLPTHAGGHLLNDLIGWQGDPHVSPFHLASYVLMGAGFIVLAKAWPVLWKAQREHQLAASGPYRWVRHPQYLGFLLIMAGFLVQWPTLLTLLMFPVLVVRLRAAGNLRGARGPGRVRCGIRGVRDGDATVRPSSWARWASEVRGCGPAPLMPTAALPPHKPAATAPPRWRMRVSPRTRDRRA